jgi:hypothetical protein
LTDPVIDEAAIRAYLLGRVRPEEELSAQFDERMLADPEFSLLIDVIEDEILEEYVEGELTAADIEAVETHFLTPPERQGKLRRMRLISRRLSSLAAENNTAPTEAHSRASSPGLGRLVIFPGIRTWVEIAAGLALVSCTIYFWNQQRELSLAVKQSKQELAQWKQAAGPLTTAQTATVTLNLFVPGLSRGDQALPGAHLPPGATTLHISVALAAKTEGPLSVRLQQGDAVLWSRFNVTARQVAGGAVLAVDLPALVVPEGTCKMIVSGLRQGEMTYLFKVTRAR